MEHLTRVKDPVSTLVLHYHGQPAYDKRGFFTYPERCGWEKCLFNKEDFTNNGTKSVVETGFFLFEWLFFGMIHEVLGDVLEDFLDGPPNGDRTITTVHLSRNMASWARKIKSLPFEQAQTELYRAKTCLAEVAATLAAHQKSNHPCEWPLVTNATLSIWLLMDTLDEARKSISPGCFKLCGQPELHTEVVIKELEQRMIKGGWCPNQVKMCRTVFGVSNLFYASLMSRPFQRLHGACHEDECVAYRVPDPYRPPLHIVDGCACSNVYAPSATIGRLLQKGRLPLIRLEKPNDAKIKVKAAESRAGESFVAISHVWSHGMGNGLENSLPICQLKRIWDFISQHAEPPFLIWIDTLCVPRKPLSLRRCAIEGIRTVCETAQKVLVFDEELLASSINGSSDEEVLMRINLSGWMRRVWTLHEQVRSREIWFQFADGTCEQSALIEKFKKSKTNCMDANIPFSNMIHSRAVSVLANVSVLKSEPNGHCRMLRLWSLLHWRHLSWAQDETICMANALGICPRIVNTLHKTPINARMQRFLGLFKCYPAGLLFLEVPKLEQKGQRWAPASWLHCFRYLDEQKDFSFQPASVGVRFERGLAISCTYILLDSRDCDIFSDGPDFHLTVPSLGHSFTVKGYPFHRSHTKSVRNTSATRLSLCLESPLHTLLQSGIRGVLVAIDQSVLQNQCDVIYSQLLRNVRIVKYVEESCSDPAEMGLARCSDWRNRIREGHYFHEERWWCVG